MTGFAGRHVLVTGGGSGIGAAIAETLAEAGALLSLAGRSEAKLAATAARIGGGRAEILAGFDVTDSAAVARGLTAARARFGPVEILVNNAGEAPTAPFERTSPDLWSRVLDLNLSGPFRVTQAALSDIKGFGARGRIINIASTAALKGYAYVSAYCAAKHGLLGLTRALALELAKTGVTVNAVCPGFTDTALTQGAIATIIGKTGRDARSAEQALVAGNPQGRLVAPQEVADAVKWLADLGSSAVTGQAIVVAGGEIMAG